MTQLEKSTFIRLRSLGTAWFGLVVSLLAHSAHAQTTRPFQDLWIPPVLEGKNFDLTLGKSAKSLWSGATTNTYGFNGARFWGPTLIFNQGDAVQIKVKNDLDVPTTVHWHGIHLPAAMDGGPHQPIPAGGSWTSSFTVKNNASTYWYHPHPHEATQKQITMGAGGLIIIRDPIEARLALPRTYGVDDIPLVLTSRRFDTKDQFTSRGDTDKYGDYLFTNGTLDSQVSLPAQFVRLRLLNAEIERGYDLGFSDKRTFYVIATDGGLVDKPIPVTRMKLMVGERVEVLVDLSKDKPGTPVELMAFNARQPFGFPGGEPGRTPPNGGFLNNLDFRLVRINVTAPTAKPITRLPEVLTHNRFWTDAEVTERRTIGIVRFGPPNKEFAFDKKYFDMHTVDHVVKLNAVEAWTITNDRTFGHSFHIHDVQFKIVARSDGPIPDYEQGWKDTLYVPRGQSATFIARFDDFASDTDAFMYHCHMANHEDGGLMGQFLVSNDPSKLKRDALGMVRLEDRKAHPVTPELAQAAASLSQTRAPDFSAKDLSGNALTLSSLTDKKPLVLYFIERECPCSKEAAPFLDQLQKLYSPKCTVVGVINAKPEAARAWAAQVGVSFPLIADPDMTIINAYGAVRSVYTALVAPTGKIVKMYPGYSEGTLTELSASIAELARIEPKTINTAGAPKTLTSGCDLARPVDTQRTAIPPTAAPSTAKSKSGPPNVLVIVADDLGWNDVSYHVKTAPTPHIAKFAKEGVTLERFYGCPVCSPARASLVTGMMPRRFGIVDVVNAGQSLPAGIATLPGAFRSAGYATSLIGKWHLGQKSPPMQNGFDHFYGFLGAEIDYNKHTRLRGGGVDWQRDGQTVNEEGYSTFLMADDAIRQIKQRDPKRPFFLEVAFNAIHFPISAPAEYIAKYQSLGGSKSTYVAAVDALDASIGRILDSLDEQGLRDNTLVVFFSDNGAEGDNSPLRSGKGSVFEGGIRTPAAIRWPGHLPAGTTMLEPVCVHDLYPTIAGAVGVAVPASAMLDGHNMWPALTSGKPTGRPPFAIAMYDIAFFDGDWKLIENQKGERSLYRITADISERTDELASQPAVAQRLIAELEALKKDLPAVPARRVAGPGSGGPGGVGSRPRPGSAAGNGTTRPNPARALSN